MKKTIVAIFSVSLLILLGGASCTNQPAQQQQTTPPPPQNDQIVPPVTRAEIKTALNEKVGRYFTDSNGMALYIFNRDFGKDSVCFGQCLAIWPIYYGENLIVPAELKQSDFSEITRSDGKKQTTYKGWPLYYYFNDKKAGDINGEAVNNVWYVAKENYTILFATEQNNYLVDDMGMTLYYFKSDKANTSTCTGQCLVNWPAFYAEDVVLPTTVLNKADYGEVERADKVEQSSFKGWPLYYYAKDKVKGDKTGQGLGGVWFMIDPAALGQAPK